MGIGRCNDSVVAFLISSRKTVMRWRLVAGAGGSCFHSDIRIDICSTNGDNGSTVGFWGSDAQAAAGR
jgi:hypothetical protein